MRAAYRLIAIALDERILKHASASLPANWMTLYAIHELDDDEFYAALADGTINSALERPQLRVWRRRRREQQERRQIKLITSEFVIHHAAIADVHAGLPRSRPSARWRRS